MSSIFAKKRLQILADYKQDILYILHNRTKLRFCGVLSAEKRRSIRVRAQKRRSRKSSAVR
jgi:hypothetical protein